MIAVIEYKSPKVKVSHAKYFAGGNFGEPPLAISDFLFKLSFVPLNRSRIEFYLLKIDVLVHYHFLNTGGVTAKINSVSEIIGFRNRGQVVHVGITSQCFGTSIVK